MNVHDRSTPFVGETLAGKRWWKLVTLLFGTGVIWLLHTSANAADLLDFPPRYQHRSTAPVAHKRYIPAYHVFEDIDRAATPSHAEQPRTSVGERSRPRPPRDSQLLVTQAASSGAARADASSSSAPVRVPARFFVTILGVLLFCALATASIIVVPPILFGAIDALFVPSTVPELDPADGAPDAEPMSAADIRSQTEILRSLKEQLDAEIAAAREAIRRERARGQQREGKETA